MGKILEIAKKNKKPAAPKKKFEERAKVEKLYLYFTIVNRGIGDSVVKLMNSLGSSLSFVQSGEGTANSATQNILGITDPHREVVVSFVKESMLKDIEKELCAFYAATKKNQGIGFAVSLTSIMGVRTYKFLTQTI